MLFLLDISDLQQIFGNLYGVESRTLANLVTAEPEGQTTVVCQILADTSYIDIVLAGSIERHRIDEVGWIILQSDTWSSGNSLLCLLYAERTLGLNSYAL